MPRASAIRDDLEIIDNGLEIKCGKDSPFGGTCGRLLIRHGRAKCQKCKSEYNLAELLALSLGDDETSLASAVDTLQFKVWSKQTMAAARRCTDSFNADKPRRIPGWAELRLTYMRKAGFVLIYLPRRHEWVFAARSTDYRVQRTAGIAAPTARSQDLGSVFVGVQSFLDDIYLNWRIPEDASQWREVQYCLSVANGMTPPPTEPVWPPDPEWVGVTGRFHLVEMGRKTDSTSPEEQHSFTLLGWSVDPVE